MSKPKFFSRTVVLVGFLVIPYPTFASWSAPSLTPMSSGNSPTDNLAISNTLEPITASMTAQTKWGSLTIGQKFQVGGLTQLLSKVGVGSWFDTSIKANANHNPLQMLDVDGIVRANDFCLRSQTTTGTIGTGKCLADIFSNAGSSSGVNGIKSLTAGANIVLSPYNPITNTGFISATPKTVSCGINSVTKLQQALISIGPDGTPSCADLPPAGSATVPVTGLSNPLNDTSITISTPNNIASVKVNTSVIQARVTGSCANGMASINTSGGAICVPYPSCSISGQTITCGANNITIGK